MKRTILISGCSTGIGRHCALHLARSGNWEVFASARREEDVKELRDMGLAAMHIDVDDPDSVARGFEHVLEQTDGRLDALFNNAGYGIMSAMEDLKREAFEDLLRTNVLGFHEMTRHAIRIMRIQGEGRIVFNSSVLGFVCMRHRGAYNASKHAVEGMAGTLRLELAGTGIHVVSIQPGPIVSRFRDTAMKMHHRHVDIEGSRFKEAYQRADANWRKGVRSPAERLFTLGPEAVCKALVKALDASSPRAQYRITIPTSLFWWLKRTLPTRLMDAIAAKV